MVPLENIYYLLAYAWDGGGEFRRRAVGTEASPGIEALLARLLHQSASSLVQRGLDRAYVTRDEALASPRGKFLLAPTIAEGLLMKGRVRCQFDELDPNLLHNQLVRAALRALSRVPNVPKDDRVALRNLSQRFMGVDDVPLERDAFSRVNLNRLNAHYRFPLHLAELLSRRLLPTTEAGKLTFDDFRASPQEMGRIFERFVIGFIRRELPALRLLPRRSEWQASALRPAERALLPDLVADAPITDGASTLIVECKYYHSMLGTGRGGREMLRSDHLNQLYAYLANAREDYPRPLAGMLLYAKSSGAALDLEYELGEYPVRVFALDLDQPWPRIDATLRRVLVETLERTRRRSDGSFDPAEHESKRSLVRA